MRCKKQLADVTLREQISCKSCFTAWHVQRIKTGMRVQCQFTKGSRLLLAASGGAASTCLAHALSIVSDRRNPKRLFFEFDLIYIDESALVPGGEDEHAAFNEGVHRLYDQYGVQMHTARLEDVMNICRTDGDDGTSDAAPASSVADTSAAIATPACTSTSASPSPSSNRQSFQALVTSLKDPSDRADMVQMMKLRVIAHVARTKGYRQVILGDSSTRTAIDAFADTAKGRGSTVAFSGLAKERRFQVEFLYPLRDLTNTHIALYNHFNQLQPIYRHNAPNMRKVASTAKMGINKLTFDFLTLLDSKFSSTVGNIIGTVGKLRLPAEYEQWNSSPSSAHGGGEVIEDKTPTETSHCALCGRVRVGKEDSEMRRTAYATIQHATAKTPAAIKNAEILASMSLCYGCKSLLTELPDVTSLPPYVLVGPSRDHRGATSYPAPFNSFIHSGRDTTKGGMAAAIQQMRISQQSETGGKTDKQNERGADAADDDDGSTGLGLESAFMQQAASDASSHHQHQMVKQSREDMRAAIDEFVLKPDESP